jgi:hypothetical protein
MKEVLNFELKVKIITSAANGYRNPAPIDALMSFIGNVKFFGAPNQTFIRIYSIKMFDKLPNLSNLDYD